jgi:hypothetical protein
VFAFGAGVRERESGNEEEEGSEAWHMQGGAEQAQGSRCEQNLPARGPGRCGALEACRLPRRQRAMARPRPASLASPSPRRLRPLAAKGDEPRLVVARLPPLLTSWFFHITAPVSSGYLNRLGIAS